jgi:hypothetical protein
MNGSEGLPHVKRGRLKNGNPSGDFMSAPRCRAHSRRTKLPCRAPAMKNGRCRMHGGRSTGPTTEGGKERSKKANLRHGRYSAASRIDKELLTVLLREWDALDAELKALG